MPRPRRAQSPLLSITYVSTSTEAPSTEDLLRLLRTARRNNARLQVTGALLFANGLFVQTIEGQEPAVQSTFRALRDDPRHTDVEVVLTQRIVRRSFPDWSMGFREISHERALTIPAYSDYLDSGRRSWTTARSQPGAIHDQFRVLMTSGPDDEPEAPRLPGPRDATRLTAPL